MPRGKKAKDKLGAVESTPVTSCVDSEATLKHEAGDAVEPPQPASDSAPQASAARGQFRSWVVDMKRGFTRLTDETNHRLVLQFHEKPQHDVLTALKGAGFEYKPDYHGQKNAWVRRNDFEGRLQVDAIEKLLSGLSTGRESAPR